MLLHRGFTGSSSHTQAYQFKISPEKAPVSVVVVDTRACVEATVAVETPHCTPLLQTGGAVPRLPRSAAAVGVGVALPLQTIRKYGAPPELSASPTHEISSPELVGVLVDDSNSSTAKLTQIGGVLSTVMVVVAVCASTFSNSVLPALKRNTNAKTKIPDKAAAMVILPAV